jgi:hypothetical protein
MLRIKSKCALVKNWAQLSFFSFFGRTAAADGCVKRRLRNEKMWVTGCLRATVEDARANCVSSAHERRGDTNRAE